MSFKKVVFLDRDGVINKRPPEHDYVRKWEEFEFLPGAIEAIRLLNQSDYRVFVVTNQRGIARRLMTEKNLAEIHKKMRAELAKNGAKIDEIYYCPHNIGECECRKPKPGLFFRAAGDHRLDLGQAIFIGDSRSGIQAGKAAGCQTILMPSNGSLLSVVKIILGRKMK